MEDGDVILTSVISSDDGTYYCRILASSTRDIPELFSTIKLIVNATGNTRGNSGAGEDEGGRAPSVTSRPVWVAVVIGLAVVFVIGSAVLIGVVIFRSKWKQRYINEQATKANPEYNQGGIEMPQIPGV